MPRLEKWLSDVAPGRSTSDVARELLAQRLEAVGSLLDGLFASDDEVEAVHQLRVWTRRAAAALALFKPLLPSKRRKRLKKKLRRLRSSAGAVRDCDIHFEHFSREKQPNHRLLKSLTRARRRALRDLKAVVQRTTRGHRLKRQSTRLLQAVDASCDQPFGDFVRSAMASLAHDFFLASDADINDDNALHALRIVGKRWRYALELADSALQAPWVRELYNHLSELQDRLGAMHDQVELSKRVAHCLDAAGGPKRREKLRCLLDHQYEELATQRDALRQWWTTARRQQFEYQWEQAFGLCTTASQLSE